jgi:hypothetical protein
MIFANYNKGRFRTRVAEKTVMAGSVVRLRVKGIMSLAPLAILSGRLNGQPMGLFGKGIIPYEESLEALIQVPSDAVGGTYIFLAQQWEPSGQPGYAGGSLVYASSVSFVEVRPYIDEETSWDSFELWSEEDAEEIRENIRRAKGFRQACCSLPFELFPYN